MGSFNFAVIGGTSIADEPRKKGTNADTTLCERESSGRILTFVVPSAFPDKIQPLVHPISLAEYVILNAPKIFEGGASC